MGPQPSPDPITHAMTSLWAQALAAYQCLASHPSQDTPHPFTTPFPCKNCGKTRFKTKEALDQHMKYSPVCRGFDLLLLGQKTAPLSLSCTHPGCNKNNFQSEQALYQHEQASHVRPLQCQVVSRPDYSIRVELPVPEESYRYEKQFLRQWKDDRTKPTIIRVLKIRPPEQVRQRFEARLALYGKETRQVFFHGTRLECNIHETKRPCLGPGCSVCCIMKEGFRLPPASQVFQRFGQGIYVTDDSFKAGVYSQRKSPPAATVHAVFVVSVAQGVVHRTQDRRNGPPPEHHTVQGKVGRELKRPEWCVYEGDTILPTILICYKI